MALDLWFNICAGHVTLFHTTVLKFYTHNMPINAQLAAWCLAISLVLHSDQSKYSFTVLYMYVRLVVLNFHGPMQNQVIDFKVAVLSFYVQSCVIRELDLSKNKLSGSCVKFIVEQ